MLDCHAKEVFQQNISMNFPDDQTRESPPHEARVSLLAISSDGYIKRAEVYGFHITGLSSLFHLRVHSQMRSALPATLSFL